MLGVLENVGEPDLREPSTLAARRLPPTFVAAARVLAAGGQPSRAARVLDRAIDLGSKIEGSASTIRAAEIEKLRIFRRWRASPGPLADRLARDEDLNTARQARAYLALAGSSARGSGEEDGTASTPLDPSLREERELIDEVVRAVLRAPGPVLDEGSEWRTWLLGLPARFVADLALEEGEIITLDEPSRGTRVLEIAYHGFVLAEDTLGALFAALLHLAAEARTGPPRGARGVPATVGIPSSKPVAAGSGRDGEGARRDTLRRLWTERVEKEYASCMALFGWPALGSTADQLPRLADPLWLPWLGRTFAWRAHLWPASSRAEGIGAAGDAWSSAEGSLVFPMEYPERAPRAEKPRLIVSPVTATSARAPIAAPSGPAAAPPPPFLAAPRQEPPRPLGLKSQPSTAVPRSPFPGAPPGETLTTSEPPGRRLEERETDRAAPSLLGSETFWPVRGASPDDWLAPPAQQAADEQLLPESEDDSTPAATQAPRTERPAAKEEPPPPDEDPSPDFFGWIGDTLQSLRDLFSGAPGEDTLSGGGPGPEDRKTEPPAPPAIESRKKHTPAGEPGEDTPLLDPSRTLHVTLGMTAKDTGHIVIHGAAPGGWTFPLPDATRPPLDLLLAVPDAARQALEGASRDRAVGLVIRDASLAGLAWEWLVPPRGSPGSPDRHVIRLVKHPTHSMHSIDAAPVLRAGTAWVSVLAAAIRPGPPHVARDGSEREPPRGLACVVGRPFRGAAGVALRITDDEADELPARKVARKAPPKGLRSREGEVLRPDSHPLLGAPVVLLVPEPVESFERGEAERDQAALMRQLAHETARRADTVVLLPGLPARTAAEAVGLATERLSGPRPPDPVRLAIDLRALVLRAEAEERELEDRAEAALEVVVHANVSALDPSSRRSS